MGSQGRPRTYHPDRPSTTAERQRVWRRQHAAEVARLRQKARQKAYHESQRYDWETPPAVFAEYDAEFHFTLDVCASDQTAKCARYFTPADDGLTQDWGQEICWMNPPYGDAIGKWMEKAYRSSLAGATVVCLVPARTDVQWWHAWVIDKASEVRLRKGRITFLGTDGLPAKNSAGFPSVAAIYRPFIV
jgi:phage N-6-adenine-methyltransferase